MMRTSATLLGLTFALVAGCAAPADTATPVPTGTMDMMAHPMHMDLAVATTGLYPLNPGFSVATLTAHEGALVNLTMTNGDQDPLVGHNFVIEGVNETLGTIQPGESGTFSFTAPAPGEYTFYCSIGDHRSRGMEGKFVVEGMHSHDHTHDDS